jgi:hypothetical protein
LGLLAEGRDRLEVAVDLARAVPRVPWWLWLSFFLAVLLSTLCVLVYRLWREAVVTRDFIRIIDLKAQFDAACLDVADMCEKFEERITAPSAALEQQEGFQFRASAIEQRYRVLAEIAHRATGKPVDMLSTPRFDRNPLLRIGADANVAEGLKAIYRRVSDMNHTAVGGRTTTSHFLREELARLRDQIEKAHASPGLMRRMMKRLSG